MPPRSRFARSSSFSIFLLLLVGRTIEAQPTNFAKEPIWTRSPGSPQQPNLPPKIVRVQATLPVPTPAVNLPAAIERIEGGALGLDDFIRIALSKNPRIAKATFGVEAAQGKRVQAGLYPNPVLSITGDELGDKTGQGGIWTTPHISQEIVTGRKLSLSQAVAAKEVDQATLAILNERFAVIGAVRAAFYEAFALQRRGEILRDMKKLTEQSVVTGQKLLDTGAIARLDLIQLEVEFERVRAEHEAVERELPAAYRRLAAIAGDADLERAILSGSFETSLPDYDLQQSCEIIQLAHPEARWARLSVEKYQVALKRAQVEPIPNFALSSGYTRQNQNKSSDWLIGVSLPLPVFNRNQGNIRSAQADIGSAVQEVRRVQNDLVDRLAVAYRSYSAARQRAARYGTSIVPRADETFKLSTEAFKGGQFEYLRVLQAQRALIEARLEYNRSLGEAWKSAGEISGLLLEESWPLPAVMKPK